MGEVLALYERVFECVRRVIMEIAKSFKDLQELIGKDLAEEVKGTYPDIVSEKKINVFFSSRDWFEDYMFSVLNRNTLETTVFGDIYLEDIVNTDFLTQQLWTKVDHDCGFVCSDGTIVTWVDENDD